ncbi:MAG: molybdopterin molybdotransferase MoeA [Bacillota bacterium]
MSQEFVKPNREEMIELLRSKVEFERRTEMVRLEDVVGRVTAKEIYAKNTLPNQPTSALDGIAVRFSDVVGGEVDTTQWELGQEYVFSNTGVAIPTDYDTVIPIERVDFTEDGKLQVEKFPSYRGEKVKSRGSMMEAGNLILPANYLINPSQLGVLAAGGIRELEVIAKPKVAIIPTGNELIPAGIPVPDGKNVETNSLVFSELVKKWGGQPLAYPIIDDDPEQLYDTLCQALSEAEIIVLNAGSSKGEDDYAVDILERVGEVITYQVAHGPAKPTNFTLADNKPILGLVGPPSGAKLTANWYLQPLIRSYLGQPKFKPQQIKARLTEGVSSPVDFDFYRQVIVTEKDGEHLARPLNRAKDSRINYAVKANGLLLIPGGKEFKVGEVVTVELQK